MFRQDWRRLDENQTTISPSFVVSTTQPVLSVCGKMGSAKAYLHQLCTAKHWKQPLFECCNEEGPGHHKMFTFKVVVSTEEGTTIVECFGNPRTSKKAAAEDAAEGALWCLNHLMKQ
ncbi:RNAse THREE-like protein 1 [Perilla frutescens var. frutescens]|nr:RNAse THREE-like protein 1 [Perilla frutescens var. frutescens]